MAPASRFAWAETRRGRWGVVGLLSGVVLLAFGAFGVIAQTEVEHLDVTVRGAVANDGLTEIGLDGQSFDQVSRAVDDAVTASTPVALLAAPNGMADLVVEQARIQRSHTTGATDGGHRAMSVRGMVVPPAAAEADTPPMEVLVTALWADQGTTAPETAVLLKWDAIGLSEFVPFDAQEVELQGAWLGLRRPTSLTDTDPLTVPAALTEDTADFLADGRDSTTDDVAVRPTYLQHTDPTTPAPPTQAGVTFRGVLDHDGALADTFQQIGLSSTVRLDGTVSLSAVDRYACPGFNDGTEVTCPVGKAPRQLAAWGVELSATVPIADADTGRFPDHVTQGADWTVGVSANTAQQAALDISGSAIVTVADEEFQLRGSLGFTHDKVTGVDQVSLSLTRPNVRDTFGIAWLDFRSIGAEVAFTSLSTRHTRTHGTPSPAPSPSSRGVFTIDLSAVMDLEGLAGEEFRDQTATATIAVAGGSQGVNATLTLDTDAKIRMNRILRAAGAQEVDEFDVGIDDFGLSVKLASPHPCPSTPAPTPTPTTSTTATATPTTTPSPTPTTTPSPTPSPSPTTCGAAPTPTPSPSTGTTRRVEKTIVVTGSLMVGWGEPDGDADGTRATIATDVFTRFVIDPDGKVVGHVVNIRGDADAPPVTVGQLIGEDLGADVELPSFDVSWATQDWFVRKEFLDPATLEFTRNQDLLVRSGVRLGAEVHVTGPLKNAFAELGPVIDEHTPLRISGALPVFGSQEFNLAIDLPRFETPADEPGVFRKGDLQVAMGRRLVDPMGSRHELFFELRGDATIRVATPGVERDASLDGPTTCPEVSDDMAAYPTDCQDDLTFTVKAAITSSQRSGLSVIITGGLTTADGWHEPFGVHGLVVESVQLEVAVTAGGSTSATPRVEVGLQGSVTLGSGADTDTYTIAFLIGVTPAPPYLQPLGFTFAASSFGMDHLVDLYETVSGEHVDTSSLPAIWLEDVYIAFGMVDRPTLCIRQGFYLAAELHHAAGGMPDGAGNAPACNGAGNLPPQGLGDLPRSCGDDASCLAAVLIDVQLGQTIDSVANSRLIAKGYFAPSNVGPLDFHETRVELSLSAQQQQFFIAGGVSIINPLYGPDVDDDSLYYLAEGSFRLDLSITRLELMADVQVGGDMGLGARVTGAATFQDGSGGFSLDDPTFELTIELRTEALDALAESISDGFAELGETVDTLGPIVEQAATNTAADIEQLFADLATAVDGLGADIELAVITEVLATLEDAQTFFASVNAELEKIGWEPIDGDALIDVVLHGFDGPTIDLSIHGFEVPIVGGCFLYEEDGTCWIVREKIQISFPGVCDNTFARDHAICRDGVEPEDAVAMLATEQFERVAESDDVGLDLDRITADVAAARSAAGASSRAMASMAQPISSEQVLMSLDEEFTGSGVFAHCAAMDLTLDSKGGVVAPLQIAMAANGARTAFGSRVDLATGDFAAGGQTLQDGVASIVTQNVTGDDRESDCSTPPPAVTAPAVTMELVGSDAPEAMVIARVDEGATFWARGTAPAGTTVSIDWGDGSQDSTVDAGDDGTWRASHVPADDGSFSITAAAEGGGEAHGRLVVDNVAPTLTTTLVEPTTDAAGCDDGACVTEGDRVVVEVTVEDPGADDHTVSVRWGDGTPATSQYREVGGSGTLRFTHHYVDEGRDDDLPSQLEIVTTASDHDRDGTSTRRADLRVHNDTPEVTTVDVVSVDGCDAVPCGDPDQPWTPEAASVTYEITVHDQGSYDDVALHLDWGDDSPATIVDVPAPMTHPLAGDSWRQSLTRTVQVTHTWWDDGASGTAVDDHLVQVHAVDADTASSASVERTIEVRDVAPAVEALAVAATEGTTGPDGAAVHVENRSDIVAVVTFDDVSPLDSHVVTIDWGEGWTATTTDLGVVAATGATLDRTGHDERYTRFTVAAPGAGADTSRSVTLVNRYGDDGTFPVTVDVVDDDTLAHNGAATVHVDNEAPVHGIDRDAVVATGQAFDVEGVGTTWFGIPGQRLTFEDDANDVGSDDLTFHWSLHEGTPFGDVLTTWYALTDGPVGAPDAVLSPQVDPSRSGAPAVGDLDRTHDHVTDTVHGTWDSPCLYGTTVEVVDDDGGAPDADHVPVAIQRRRQDGDDAVLNFGQWKAAIRTGKVDRATADCLLDIAGHLSTVLLGRSELDGASTPWTDPVGTVDLTRWDGRVPAVLSDPPKKGTDPSAGERHRLDRSLTAALLNLADGAFAWDSELETGMPFWQMIQEIEHVRRTSDDPRALRKARQRLWILGIG